jgi:MFS transporter, DHA3 family, macrolide efflux protein
LHDPEVKAERRDVSRPGAATARPPGWAARLAGRARASPYHPALSHPVIRRVLPGAAASALGDGMSAVAIAWLALKLAPEGSRGLWVGAAVAAYSLPGAAGAVALRRWLRGRGGAGLAFVNAVLRAAALGLIGCLAIAGLLDPAGYVALLGVSSLLSAWGVAGKYTLIADLLPPEQRVAGNTVFGLADQLSLMVGPALAGVLAAAAGPAVVIAADAASWAVLAISYARIAPLAARPAPAPAPAAPAPAAPAPAAPAPAAPAPAAPAALGGTSAPGPAPQSTGPPTPVAAAPGAWAVIRSSPVLPGLLALSFVFYLLYGPVEVALPVHVATDLHGSAALLGTFWAVFGVGAVIGELSAPFLRRWRVWPTMTGIVLGWGLALVPLGLVIPLWAALAAFFTGAVIWGPWMSLSMAVLQDASPPDALAQVIAARSSLLIVASPLGTAFGGPIVAALGARGTLLVSGLATIALGLITTAVLAARRRRHEPRPARRTTPAAS